MHGWQGEKFTEELIASADNPDLTVEIILTEGNWMIPSVQIEAVEMITEALSGVDVENSAAYQDNADEYVSIIMIKGDEIEAELADYDLSSIKVLCNEQQAGFVKWTGLDIITTYGRPDSLTPQIVKDLVDTGTENDVTLIIDNLQSGADAGAGIAEELSCTRIVLSNFPGGFDDTETWEKAIDYNIDLILEAIAR
jgi:zinc transport system substrate-binding protein